MNHYLLIPVSEFERVKKIIECQNCEHFYEDKENNNGTFNTVKK